MGGYKVVVPPFTVDKKSADDDKDEPKIPLKKVEQFFYAVCSAAELQEFDNLKNCSDTIVYSGTGVVHPELLKLLSRYMEVVIVNPEANTTFSVGLCRADDLRSMELRIEKFSPSSPQDRGYICQQVATINLATGVIEQKPATFVASNKHTTEHSDLIPPVVTALHIEKALLALEDWLWAGEENEVGLTELDDLDLIDNEGDKLGLSGDAFHEIDDADEPTFLPDHDRFSQPADFLRFY